MNPGEYRYELSRKISPPLFNQLLGHFTGERESRPSRVAVIMLNPSTATAEKNDPTIRRVIGFAEREGWREIRILNLFAYRGTDKGKFLDFAAQNLEAAIGPENDTAFRNTFYDWADAVLTAWGALPGWAVPRTFPVYQILLNSGLPVYSLGELTQGGQPRHPLYLKADTPLIPRDPAEALRRFRADLFPGH